METDYFPVLVKYSTYPRVRTLTRLYRVSENPHRSTSPKREVEQHEWCYAEMRREAVLRVIYFCPIVPIIPEAERSKVQAEMPGAYPAVIGV